MDVKRWPYKGEGPRRALRALRGTSITQESPLNLRPDTLHAGKCARGGGSPDVAVPVRAAHRGKEFGGGRPKYRNFNVATKKDKANNVARAR